MAGGDAKTEIETSTQRMPEYRAAAPAAASATEAGPVEEKLKHTKRSIVECVKNVSNPNTVARLTKRV